MRDLNPRPTACKAVALPLRQSPMTWLIMPYEQAVCKGRFQVFQDPVGAPPGWGGGGDSQAGDRFRVLSGDRLLGSGCGLCGYRRNRIQACCPSTLGACATAVLIEGSRGAFPLGLRIGVRSCRTERRAGPGRARTAAAGLRAGLPRPRPSRRRTRGRMRAR